jgi:hypothetical protein
MTITKTRKVDKDKVFYQSKLTARIGDGVSDYQAII